MESGIMLNYLPNELVTDILSRLPVRSLTKFRIVCKSWDALTRDPIFITNHMRISSSSVMTEDSTKTIVQYHSNTEANISSSICDSWLRNYFHFVLKVPFFHQGSRLLMFGPCNGIVCLYGYHEVTGSNRVGVNGEYLALWNPATRETKVLPSSNFVPPNDFIPLPSMIILGHDHATNDYKIVKIIHGFLVENREYEIQEPYWSYCEKIGMRIYESCRIKKLKIGYNSYTNCVAERVEVYSLNKNSWKPVETKMLVTATDMMQCWFEYVHLNGFCYWTRRHVVISFDVTNEVFSEIVIPTETADCHVLRLDDPFILNGSLCIRTKDTGNILSIWAMVEEKERGSTTNRQWVKQSEVDLSTYYNVRILRKNGDMIVQYFDDGRFEYYDSSNRNFKSLNDILSSHGIGQPIFCTETLVSLKTT